MQLCDQYQGEKRHAIPHIYKYYIYMDSAPFYCSLCHFITTRKKKLQDHVTHYAKHRCGEKHGRQWDVLTFKLGFNTFGREKLFCKDKQKRVS